MNPDNGVVVFDPEAFKTAFPQFQNVPDETLQSYFSAACLLLNNTENSPVTDLQERATLLNLLVCHIATLKSRGDASVGIISSAAEGSVNVSLTPLNNMNWYKLTQCGFIFWNATAKYRQGIRWYCGC